MKKIIFCLQSMALGGVERELNTVLKRMNPSEYEISVLLMYSSDLCAEQILPQYVHVINLNIDRRYYCSGLFNTVRMRLKNHKYKEAISIFFKRIFGIGMTRSNIDISEITALESEYDVAICYQILQPIVLKYVAEKIKATKKIVWIHNELDKIKYPVPKLMKYLNKYDEAISVSKKVKMSFDKLARNFNGCSSFAHNIIDVDEIVEKASGYIDKSFMCEKACKILTVGRFSPQKGFDQAIKCSYLLKKSGLNFRWYFIGYGEEEKKYIKLISKYSLEDYISILGKKENPYPYFENCDIYCQPSRHEAWCLTITEAKVFHKPIVCTDFAGADEQLENGVTGIIVPINDLYGLFENIKAMINNPDLKNKLSRNLAETTVEMCDWESIRKHF